MFNQITDTPDWFQEYLMLIAGVTAIGDLDIDDVNAFWDLNQ